MAARKGRSQCSAPITRYRLSACLQRVCVCARAQRAGRAGLAARWPLTKMAEPARVVSPPSDQLISGTQLVTGPITGGVRYLPADSRQLVIFRCSILQLVGNMIRKFSFKSVISDIFRSSHYLGSFDGVTLSHPNNLDSTKKCILISHVQQYPTFSNVHFITIQDNHHPSNNLGNISLCLPRTRIG